MSGPAGTTRRRCRRAWSFSLPSSTRAQCAQRAPALGLADTPRRASSVTVTKTRIVSASHDARQAMPEGSGHYRHGRTARHGKAEVRRLKRIGASRLSSSARVTGAQPSTSILLCCKGYPYEYPTKERAEQLANMVEKRRQAIESMLMDIKEQRGEDAQLEPGEQARYRHTQVGHRLDRVALPVLADPMRRHRSLPEA